MHHPLCCIVKTLDTQRCVTASSAAQGPGPPWVREWSAHFSHCTIHFQQSVHNTLQQPLGQWWQPIYKYQNRNRAPTAYVYTTTQRVHCKNKYCRHISQTYSETIGVSTPFGCIATFTLSGKSDPVCGIRYSQNRFGPHSCLEINCICICYLPGPPSSEYPYHFHCCFIVKKTSACQWQQQSLPHMLKRQ